LVTVYTLESSLAIDTDIKTKTFAKEIRFVKKKEKLALTLTLEFFGLGYSIHRGVWMKTVIEDPFKLK
jgi:hypothetical protein